MMNIKGRTLIFDEAVHKYTDDWDTEYTSVTTLIGHYVEEFEAWEIAKACEKIGCNPLHKKYEHYRGKSAITLMEEWKKINEESKIKGTKKHLYMEMAIKDVVESGRNNNVLPTLDDVILGKLKGKIDIEKVRLKFEEKYPDIYSVIYTLWEKGYRFFSEIGVYDNNMGVSGMIDLFCLNPDESQFIIMDWKTNRAPVRFEAGYWSKSADGKLSDYVFTGRTMRPPLDHLGMSVGNEYKLQLSAYAYLAETFGFKCKSLILNHLRTVENDTFESSEKEEREVVDIHVIDYDKYSVETMIDDYRKRRKL
jgi:hypothetical protein